MQLAVLSIVYMLEKIKNKTKKNKKTKNKQKTKQKKQQKKQQQQQQKKQQHKTAKIEQACLSLPTLQNKTMEETSLIQIIFIRKTLLHI